MQWKYRRKLITRRAYIYNNNAWLDEATNDARRHFTSAVEKRRPASDISTVHASGCPCPAGRREAIDLAAEGGRWPQLGGAGPQHVLVIRRGNGGADEWTHPEDPLQSQTKTGQAIDVRHLNWFCRSLHQVGCDFIYMNCCHTIIQITNGVINWSE